MTTFISPGVYTVEQDLSAYVSDLSSTIVGMVGTADTGPTNTPVLITTASDFVNTFGNLNPDHYLGYAALSYLQQGSMLWVTRVVSNNATYADVAMFLPKGYQQYTGQWTLAGQTSTSLTFNLADSSTVSGSNKTIVLTTNTPIPNFDPTDSTNTASANGKIGADFTTLTALTTNSPVLGVPFSILTGAGKNTTPIITAVNNTTISSVTVPQVTVPLSAFSTTNSPATTLATGSISLAVPSTWTPPTNYAPLMTVGITSTGLPINLAYTTTSGSAILTDVNNNAFSSTDLESLLYITTGTPSATGGTASFATVSSVGQMTIVTTATVGSIVIGEIVTAATVPADTFVTGLVSGTANTIGAVYSLSNTTGTIATESFSTVTASQYDVLVPLFDPTVAGNNAKSLAILNATLAELLGVVNAASAPTSTYPNTLAFYNACRVSLPNSSLYGVGSISVGGNSQGFSAVNTILDSSGNILTILLTSNVAGLLGSFYYSQQTLTTNTELITSNQVLTGTFGVGYYRPLWQMTPSGSSYVPTVLKFTSIGETDESNTAVVLSMSTGDVTVSGEQNYTITVYQRTAVTGVNTASIRLVDFTSLESYYGTIENIQSTISASSRNISLKIDYNTTDTLNITTGAVTHSLGSTDNLIFSPGFLLSETNSGISYGTNYVTATSGYNKSLTGFLLGGSIGSAVNAYDIIGNEVSTGLYSFANPEALDINVLVAPGWSADPGVATAMTSICQSRGDAIAVLDTPFGLTVQQAINYRNNVSNINSSYAAMYYPWVLIADAVNQQNVFVPPSGQVVSQYAYNDYVADMSYAPAGINRGMLTNALATERLLAQGDRDALALAHINPINNQPGNGIYIFGQYTLQTANTALNRVNVRRMLLNLRKVIATASQVFVFQPADSTTAYQLQQIANTVLSAALKAGDIQSYIIDVGPDVNTAAVLNNNQLAMQISIIPTKAAEEIIETFTILPQAGTVSVSTVSS